jgi:hypothetical protein
LNQKIIQKDLKTYKHKTLHTSRLLGILFITIGIFFILTSYNMLIKTGIILILLGLFLNFLTTKKRQTSEIFDIKIIQIIFVWTTIVFIITINVNAEILYILTFLGILIIKEITDQYTSAHFKNRLNIFIFSFFLFFTFVVVKRIINF